MELRLPATNLQIADLSAMRQFRHKLDNSFRGNIYSPFLSRSKKPASEIFTISSALPETAVSVAVAATIVGTAATLLVKRTESSKKPETLTKDCEDCGGSGICSECNGEGYVLKKLSEESAEKARMMAKNAATRYTAGLPKSGVIAQNALLAVPVDPVVELASSFY